MTGNRRHTAHRRVTDQVSFLYIATFNNGQFEERFFASDDVEAARAAHDIAGRKKLTLDAWQRVGKKTPGGTTDGEIFSTTPQYFCESCNKTFLGDKTAIVHHSETEHNITSNPERAFEGT